MIYYLCPDSEIPFGGIKKIYSHVDLLNKNQIPSSVLHKRRGFRCRWFDNDTQISYSKDIFSLASDYAVIPEFYGFLYHANYRRHPDYRFFDKIFNSPSGKVIFNQGTYLTFNGNSFEKNDLKNLHADKNVIGALVVSKDGKEYLQYAFPELSVFRVHNSIDSGVFSYCSNKKRQICFMPRRNAEHSLNVINVLKFRGLLSGYDVIPIDNLTEKEASAIMRESLIFLSFGSLEGFSLPPAEAMSCGCVIIGYHGMGGREYFDPEFCFPVEQGNILQFVKSVEMVMNLYETNPEKVLEMGLRASNHIRKEYSPEREEQDVLSFWRGLIRNQQAGLNLSGNPVS